MKPDDGLFLPLLQPEIPGNPAVVLVHFAVAFPPVVELAGGDVEPHNEPPGTELGERLLHFQLNRNMRHIREIDGQAHAVLMMQVGNEVGVLGDSRDRSPAANRAFDAAVPAELTTYLRARRKSLFPQLREVWDAAGGKSSGTWQEAFGNTLRADEIFMAWNYGRYVNLNPAVHSAVAPIPFCYPQVSTAAQITFWVRTAFSATSCYYNSVVASDYFNCRI
jgi:hypothetical protein